MSLIFRFKNMLSTSQNPAKDCWSFWDQNSSFINQEPESFLNVILLSKHLNQLTGFIRKLINNITSSRSLARIKNRVEDEKIVDIIDERLAELEEDENSLLLVSRLSRFPGEEGLLITDYSSEKKRKLPQEERENRKKRRIEENPRSYESSNHAQYQGHTPFSNYSDSAQQYRNMGYTNPNFLPSYHWETLTNTPHIDIGYEQYGNVYYEPFNHTQNPYELSNHAQYQGHTPFSNSNYPDSAQQYRNMGYTDPNFLPSYHWETSTNTPHTDIRYQQYGNVYYEPFNHTQNPYELSNHAQYQGHTPFSNSNYPDTVQQYGNNKDLSARTREFQQNFITERTPEAPKRSWVYLGTDSKVEGLTDNQILGRKTQGRGKSQKTTAYFLDQDQQRVQIEYITQNALNGRKGSWVYLGTASTVEGLTEDQILGRNTQSKGKSQKTTAYFLDQYQQPVQIEYITQSALDGRKGSWVYLGTGSKVEGLTEGQILGVNTQSRGKSQKTTAYFLDQYQQPVQIEYITQGALNKRKGSWVYLGTGSKVEGLTEDQILGVNTQSKGKSQKTTAYFLDQDQQPVQIEYITQGVLNNRRRKGSWVYLGTGSKVEGLTEDQVLGVNTQGKGKSQKTIAYFLDQDQQPVQIEYITQRALNGRKGSWVYFGTGSKVEGLTEDHILGVNTQGSGKSQKTTAYFLDQDQQRVQIEYITQNALNGRKGSWVYLGTGSKVEGLIEDQILGVNTQGKGKSQKTTAYFLDQDQQRVQIEYITQNALNGRKGSWVYIGTGSKVEGLTEDQILGRNTQSKGKSQKTTAYFLDQDQQRVQIEYITQSALNGRKGSWVYLGTGSKVEGLTEDQILGRNTQSKGKSQKTTAYFLDQDQQRVQIEYITQSALNERKTKNARKDDIEEEQQRISHLADKNFINSPIFGNNQIEQASTDQDFQAALLNK